MTNNTALSRNVTIINELGLHARSAAKIAKIAQQAHAKVWIFKDAVRVDAASVIDILTLEATKGSSVTFEIDSPSDIEILAKLEKLVQNSFEE
jgi:phosphocarrier protein